MRNPNFVRAQNFMAHCTKSWIRPWVENWLFRPLTATKHGHKLKQVGKMTYSRVYSYKSIYVGGEGSTA